MCSLLAGSFAPAGNIGVGDMPHAYRHRNPDGGAVKGAEAPSPFRKVPLNSDAATL